MKALLLAGAGRRIIIRFPDLTEGGNPLEISDTFHSGTMSIENVLCSATDLDYGQCNSAMFSVTVSDAPDVTGQRIYVYEAVDGYAYSVPLFTGKVKSAELQSDKTSRKIIAYDALHSYMDYDVTDWYKSLFPSHLKPEYAGAWNGNLVYTDPAVVLYDGVYYKYLCSATDQITIAGKIYNVSRQIVGQNPAQLVYDSNFGAYVYRYSSYDPYEYETITLEAIRTALITDLGLTQTQVTLPNDSLAIHYQDNGKLTASTVLKAIGQLNAAFGHMSPEGVFQWIMLPSETVDFSGNIRSDTSYSEYAVRVPDGIAALAADGTELYKTASGDNLWVMQNLFLYNADVQTALGNLVTYLPTFAYTPANVKAIISLPVELGAAIMFTTNTGATVTTYNLSESLSGVQLITQTMTAQGNLVRDNSSTIYDTVEALRARTQSIQSATDIAANYAVINRNSAEAAAEAADAAQSTADGRTNVYHQDAAPDPEEADLKTGDTWFDTSNGNQVHRYAGSDQLTDENGELLVDENGVALFSEPWTEEPFSQSAIAEEGITTEHLAVGAVTADKIHAGAITTDKLAANAVTADKIDVIDLFAQDITATGTITGATLRGIDAEIEAGTIGGFTIDENNISGTAEGTEFTLSSSDSTSFIRISKGSMHTHIGLNLLRIVGSTHDTGVVITNTNGKTVRLIYNANDHAGLYDDDVDCWGIRYNQIHGEIYGNEYAVRIGAGDSAGANAFVPRKVTTASKDAASDGEVTCGSPLNRWLAVYSQNGVVSSSDERIKIIHRELGEDHKKLLMALKPIEYSFVHTPGKKHFGLGAQTTEATLADHGFGEEYSIVEHSYYDEEDSYGRHDTYNMNYTEVAMLAIPVIQDQQREIEALKKEVAELKNMIMEVVNG